MIEDFMDIIKEFERLGYSYNYFPESNDFDLFKSRDDDGLIMVMIDVYTRNKSIRLDGCFDKEELNLIKKLIEKLEEK